MQRNTLTQNHEVKAGTILDELESGWTRDNAADTVTCPSTDYFKTGSGSTKFTVGAGRANGSFTKTINQVVNPAVSSIWVYIPDTTKLGATGVGFFYSSTTDFSKYYTCTYPKASLHNGWNKLQFKKEKWAATGGEVWTNTMIRLRIRLYADGTNACTAYFDSWNIGEYHKPKLMIHFDDCFQSALDEGYSYMNSRGLKGTFFVINTSIGAAGYMTAANLSTVYSNGWDLGTHGLTDLTTMGTQAEMEADIATNKAYLSAYPRANMHYAYPSGGINDTAVAAITSQGMVTGRGVQIRVQSVMPDEPLRLNAVSITNATALATAKGYVDEAIASGGLYTIIFHELVASPAAANEWAISDFQAFVDYIYKKQLGGELDVVTISEWYNGLTSPRATVTSRTAV